jgi:hypothetical protein
MSNFVYPLWPIAKIAIHALVAFETPGSDVYTRPDQYGENKEMRPLDFKPPWKTATYRRANEVVEGAYP